MRKSALLLAAAIVAGAGLAGVGVTASALDSGQGTAAPDTRVEGLRLGDYWYGSQITHDDLIGKVVLVELWGS
jgi:hypothetical protein